MPDLNDLGDGVVAAAIEPEHLSTTYFDTDDLRLARWGVSFRHRLGQEWTVKLPSQSDGALLSRPEFTFSGHIDDPPAGAVDLLRAFTRASDLSAQMRLTTVRRRVEISDAMGNVLADVVDDEVSVLEGQHPAARFREIEVEIRDETPFDLLETLLGQLEMAGAGPPDPTPKYIRALGPAAELAPEVTVPRLASGATAGDVVRQAIAASVVRLIEHDPVVRLDVDPEGVHQARVSTRRLRSDLRTFGSLIDPVWASALRDELGWLASILGRRRDCDVMLERMRTQAAEVLEPNAPDPASLFATLEAERNEAHTELLDSLRSERYLALVERLVSAAHAPALLLEADQSAADVLPGLVQQPWRALEKRVRTLGDHPTDEGLHDVRICTKRVRYAAEAVTPLIGRRARAFATAAAGLQEVLGDLNDAVVAERWLRDWTRTSPSVQDAFAAGELAGLERARAEQHRSQWRKKWKELSAPTLRSWM
jgi:CHAD domain-containing protein